MQSQELSNLRTRKVAWQTAVQQLDTLIVVPSSLCLIGTDTVPSTDYTLDADGKLSIQSVALSDSLMAYYRVLPIAYRDTFAFKDRRLIREEFEYQDPFAYRPGTARDRSSLFQLEGFEKRGSLARGIQVGNAQDLSVNSDLNLQLAGRITDKISLLANISDDNVPIQADGTTQQLQEFDQVYVKLYTDQASLTAGDYQVQSLQGHYNTYLKKARGALLEGNWELGDIGVDSITHIDARIGAAVSRGRFARNIVQGVEGNQGPYRLRGADNELFVIILSGTERVFIDGRPLTRGKDFDYTIDYNSAEITFTAKQLITKDDRIVVEFQYAAQSYTRSLLQASAGLSRGKWSGFVDVYSEQDGRNQPLQQELSEADRLLLSQVGDNLGQALAARFDTVAFNPDQVLYALRDSLGYDSVFVQSDLAEEAIYQLSFTRVDTGEGDYIEDDFSANGRVYRWLAPDTINGQIIHQGDHVPRIQLVTPKTHRMYTAGMRYAQDPDTWFDTEVSLSDLDINTFSALDRADDQGYVGRMRGQKGFGIGEKSKLLVGAELEYTTRDYRAVERYRAVEFERNWNLQPADLLGDQVLGSASVAYRKGAKQRIGYTAEQFSTSNGYTGLDHRVNTRWIDGPWIVSFDGSLLDTKGVTESRFTRHASDISRQFGKIRLGVRDLRDDNVVRATGDTLSALSFRFYEWETYVASADSSKWNYRVYFKQRDDWRPVADKLLHAAGAQEYGLQLATPTSSKQSLAITAAWRSLSIERPEIINSTPEETFVGRLEYRARLLEGVISTNTFYEVGSGLERRKQYIYLEVPAGQGVYVWVDYDGDEVKDLDEFEIAQFQYEANYLRVNTPTDRFEKTFSNQLAQSLDLDLSRTWRDEKGIKGILGRISNQATWRAERKTREEEGADAFNPFLLDLQDTVLLSLNNSFRNQVFFNKLNPVWSIDQSYSDRRNKQLLTNGFETRSVEELRINGRYTIDRKYTIRISVYEERSAREASYSINRSYAIDTQGLEPSIEWQPDRKLRLTAKASWLERSNALGEGEQASIFKGGLQARVSQIDKGSLTAAIDYVKIGYDGQQNSSLAFEMLDGLKTGDNFTWSAFIQRSLSKNIELNVNYNGRKSEENRAIHTGSVQVRAFF